MPPSEVNPELKRDDNYSQRGNKSSKGAVILKEGHFKHAEKPYDEIYILDPNFEGSADNQSKVCHEYGPHPSFEIQLYSCNIQHTYRLLDSL